MIKSGKTANAALTVAAFKACQGLPLATQNQVVKASAGIIDSKNQAPPGTPQDAFDGHAGSISRAFNHIVLALQGFRVEVAHIKAALASHTFETSKGVRPGLYNPNHTTDLVFEKKHENGHMVLSSGKGWVAVNPEWSKAYGAPAPAPAPAPKSADGMEQAKGLGKAAKAMARKGKGKGKGKPGSAKAVEASLTPTAADLEIAKALRGKKLED